MEDFVGLASEYVLVLLSGSGLPVVKFSTDGAGDGSQNGVCEPMPGEGEWLVRRRPRNRFVLLVMFARIQKAMIRRIGDWR